MQNVTYQLMPQPSGRTPDGVPVEFIGTTDGLSELDTAIATADAIAVDTETHDAITLPDGVWAAVRVISIATRHGAPRDGQYRKFVVDVKDIDLERLAVTMSNITLAFAWNANFDARVLRYLGTPVPRWHDVMLDEQLSWAGVDGRGWYLSLAVAAKRYLGYDVIGKGDVQTSYDASSELTDEQRRYAADDALVTLFLAEEIGQRIDEHGLRRVSDIEQGARPFIAMMMEEGFPFKATEWEQVLVAKRRQALAALIELAQATGHQPSITQCREAVSSLVRTEETQLARQLAGVLTGDDDLGVLARVAHEVGDEKQNKTQLAAAIRVELAKLGPLWNTNSEFQMRDALNQFDAQAVQARFGRPMDAADPVDKATMTELAAAGSTLASSVLSYREAIKYVTTYGADFLRYVRDGRIHSRYKQLLTATGRLSSFEPNGQNLVGPTKEYIAPPSGRVLVYADYSQAELRKMSNDAGEEAMIQAFSDGVDLHELTAKRILGIDISAMKETDPKEAKAVRTKCKRLNFGIPYGLGAAALARQLTNEGVPTTTQEAQTLLDGYDVQYPAVAAWLGQCVSFIDAFAKDPGPIDWALSFKLLRTWQIADAKRKEFKRRNKRLPSSLELAQEIIPRTAQLGLFDAPEDADSYDEQVADLAADIEWAFAYDAPLVLRPGGEPLAWEIRTTTGRRRLFTVAMDSGFKRSETDSGSSSSSSDKFDGLVTSAMLIAATTDKAHAAAVRDAWAAEHKVALPQGTDRCVRQPGENQKAFRERSRIHRQEERMRCVKAFEGSKRPLKTAFVQHMCAQMGDEAARYLLERALADQIRKSGNALRNFRIQAGVADIVGVAMGRLYELCEQYPDLRWVQSVHDSIIGECDEANGREIAQHQKRIMEEAMREICPRVAPKADAELCANLGEEGLIEAIELAPAIS